MSSDLEPLVALNLSGMVGAVLHKRLVDHFGSIPQALQAGVADLKRVQGIGDVTAQAIHKAARSGSAAKEIEAAAADGIRILAHGGPDYPAALLNLHDPPLVLYVKGTLAARDALAIGIVGSRKCTPYGERQAARFAVELAGMGVTIVSGLARGIDTRAHIGALRAKGGRTLAVMGSGLRRIYPPENRKLFEAIAEQGAVLSEFPLEAGPEPQNFPRRNRIVSGLSLGILVVEASEKSGALITADWAMEQGREVFALPGSIENPMSRGAHILIKQGAKLVETPADLLEELPALQPILQALPQDEGLSPLERSVLRGVEVKARTTDSIAAATKMPECTVTGALQTLAARGLVIEEAGSYRLSARPGASR